MSAPIVFSLCCCAAVRTARAEETCAEDTKDTEDPDECEEPIPSTICRAPAIMSKVGERPRMGRNTLSSAWPDICTQISAVAVWERKRRRKGVVLLLIV
jgi:hypothetical protein